MRDLRTRTLVYQGPVKDGAYMWSTSLQPETPLLNFSSVNVSTPIWLSCLSHLSNKLVSHLVASNQILILREILIFSLAINANAIRITNYLSMIPHAFHVLL